MVVNRSMVQEFIDVFLKDQAIEGFKVEFRREDSINFEAQKISERYKIEKYEGQSRYELLMEGVRIYKTLQSQGVIINDDMLKEHAWLGKYLPMFSSEIFSKMMACYQTRYNFLDPDEICKQTATAFMLAYHSNPTLFTQNPQEFESLANIWSDALLTFNCRKMPMLALQVPGWHDRPYYSTDRNLKFFKICSEQFLKISQSFLHMTGMDKWRTRVVAFDAILKMLPFVVVDHDMMDSHQWVDAIKACQSLEVRVSELQRAEPLPAYSPQEEQEPVDLEAAAAHVPPVYLTPEQQAMNDAGMQLIQNGVRNLLFAQRLMEQNDSTEMQEQVSTEADMDADDENEVTCFLQ